MVNPAQRSMQPAEEFSTLVHEIGHEMLHRGERRTLTTKQVRETEAEAVAFVVCQAVGLQTGTSVAGLHPALARRRRPAAREFASCPARCCSHSRAHRPQAWSRPPKPRSPHIRRNDWCSCPTCAPESSPNDQIIEEKIEPCKRAQNASNHNEYRNIPVTALVESASNPRKPFDETSLNELAASLKTQGVLSPSCGTRGGREQI